ncbi:MAG TPA: hypothetical protein VNC84_00440 [Gammaproteobacteria bacterium]|jgi:hypothetical protein|nr:hypothetical protein [Gammaproteobacteria bacterium]
MQRNENVELSKLKQTIKDYDSHLARSTKPKEHAVEISILAKAKSFCKTLESSYDAFKDNEVMVKKIDSITHHLNYLVELYQGTYTLTYDRSDVDNRSTEELRAEIMHCREKIDTEYNGGAEYNGIYADIQESIPIMKDVNQADNKAYREALAKRGYTHSEVVSEALKVVKLQSILIEEMPRQYEALRKEDESFKSMQLSASYSPSAKVPAAKIPAGKIPAAKTPPAKVPTTGITSFSVVCEKGGKDKKGKKGKGVTFAPDVKP